MAKKPTAPRQYWLMKSEPDVFSFSDLVARGAKGEAWDGVRNYQARNNMRAMRLGDRGFFYHSNEGKAVVGILEVIALAHPDPKDDSRAEGAPGKRAEGAPGKATWECVDVRAVEPLPSPVSLDTIKAEPRLAEMVLVKNSRLSVQPVTAEEWALVCQMGGLAPANAR